MGDMGHMAMPGMSSEAKPWTPGYLLASFTMWTLMMVAMMLPSAAPMILLHARINRGTVGERARDNTLFVICYLAVWTLFSAGATAGQAALLNAGLLSSGRLSLTESAGAAGLLALAAAWQLTCAKAACLEQCQSPIRFVMSYWRPGAAGAIRLGFRHGIYCLGCCWSLMLLLFAGGVMNLGWVAFLACVVFVEKIAPLRWRVNLWSAAMLAIGAIAILMR